MYKASSDGMISVPTFDHICETLYFSAHHHTLYRSGPLEGKVAHTL